MTKPLASAPHELLLPCFFSGRDESCLCSHNGLVLMLSTEVGIHFKSMISHFSNIFFPPPFFLFWFSLLV